MPRVQPKPDGSRPTAWDDYDDARLIMDLDGASVFIAVHGSFSDTERFTATPADAREIAAELIRLADEADAKGAK